MILGDPEILASVIRPARSHITAAIVDRMSALCPAQVGVHRGFAEEAPAIYVTPGRETPSREYGLDWFDAEYVIVAIVDRTQHATPDYETIDRLGSLIHQSMSASGSDALSRADSVSLSSRRPGYSEDQGDTIGIEMTYQITYSVDPADFNNAI